MTTEELCAELEQVGVALEVRDGRLGATGQVGALSDALRAQIAEHRAELLHVLLAAQGAQNPQNTQNAARDDVTWIKDRLKSVYGLIKEALREGYLGPAQSVGQDVVQMVEGVARADGDVARACRLASREGAGNDVAAAALLSAYELLCRDLAARGVDVLRRRAAVALCVAEATRLQAQAQAAAHAAPRAGTRPRARR